MDLDRLLTPTWIARRVRLCGVMQAALGLLATGGLPSMQAARTTPSHALRSIRTTNACSLLVGSILVTHPRMLTTTLGYSPPEALCLAFANADLPSSGSFRKLP